MALFKGDVLIAGTNPSGGGTGGGHIIEDSEGTELEQRPALQFIGADVQDDDTNEVTKVVTPSFREIQGDIPDINYVCFDGIPVGGIIPYGAPIDTLEESWLPCLGQAVSRTFYHELFAKYGTTYGAGDGSTTFNLPNYGGRVPVGLDENDTDFDTLGETLGEKRHTLTTQEMPKHKHFNGYKFNDGSGSSWSYRVTYGVKEGNTDGTSDGETGGGQAHNNIQPSIVANYIVKAKTSSSSLVTSSTVTLAGTISMEASSKGSINLSYPTGFNMSNCIPIAFGITREGYLHGINYIGQHKDSSTLLILAYDRTINLKSDAIYITIDNPTTSTNSVDYKIVLMKLEH